MPSNRDVSRNSNPVPLIRPALLIAAALLPLVAVVVGQADVSAQESKAKTKKGQTKADKGQAKKGDAPAAKSGAKKAAGKQKTGKAAKAGKKKMGKADGKRKVIRNPLSRFIEGLLPRAGRKRNRRVVPKAVPGRRRPMGKKNDTPKGQSPRDQIDARAPHDSAKSKLLGRAKTRIRRKQWRQALEVLERLLDPPRRFARHRDSDDALIRRSDGTLIDVRAEANRLLAGLPQEVRNEYQRKNGPKAEALLREAYADSDPSRFVQIATRFFHTTAGHRAANYLGTFHVDRGEFGLAARWFAQLLQADARVADDPKWRLKAAYVFRQVGDLSASDRLLQSLKSADLPHAFEVGGARVDPARWLDSAGPRMQDRRKVLDEWKVFYGSASRTGTARGGDPLLLERWSVPMTNSEPIQEKTDELIQDLADAQVAMIPAVFPLTVDGKVVFRTLRGVQVVSATTGEALWETHEGISAERLLSGTVFNRRAIRRGRFRGFGFRGFGFGGFRNPYGNSSDDAQFRPLTNLLFRNGTYGIISSDGEQLFVIEEHALLAQPQRRYRRRFGNRPQDAYHRDWSTNKLTSYDLNTGRPIWEVGGRRMDEPFDPPLAGNYFFGTPVPAGNQLFVVGETDNTIQLHALDSQTGVPLWSQLIAYPDVKIAEDVGRRWWSAQVALGNGVLVCPTTVGWLVGVDRLRHSVIWAYRYSKPAVNRSHTDADSNSMVSLEPLGRRWAPSAPVIVGNRVVYTPAEEAVLVCLDLFDGTRKWQKTKKSSHLYLAGVFDSRVIVVGKNGVMAYSLKDGSEAWPSMDIPSTDGFPSGFGVAVGDRYYLPLSSGLLYTIDLTNGKVLKKSHLRNEGLPLGNLVMYRGMLLSAGPAGLKSFEQREALDRRIQAQKAVNPTDPSALMSEADVSILNGQHEKALDSLRKISADALSAVDRSHFHELLIENLTAVIRSDFQAHDEELKALAAVVNTTDEQRTLARLTAERHAVRNEHAAAYDVYLQLAEADSDDTVTRNDDSRVQVSSQRWLAGRLADLWTSAPVDVRSMLDERIAAASKKAAALSLRDRQRFVMLFGFHSSAPTAQRALVEEYASMGDFASAENLLLTLTRHSDRPTAAGALERLARLLNEQGRAADGNYYYQILARRFADTTLENGELAAALVQRLRDEGTVKASADGPLVRWGHFELKMIRSGSDYGVTSYIRIAADSSRVPFFRRHRFQLDQNTQRLAVIDAGNEDLYCSIPLRGGSETSDRDNRPAVCAGHQLVVLHRGMVCCLSPAHRRSLWAKSLGLRDESSHYRNVDQQQIPGMRSGRRILSDYSLPRKVSGRGMLPVANNAYVCVFGRRNFTVYDLLTGQRLWSRDRISPSTQIYGTEEVLFVVGGQKGKALAFRALDGKRLDIPEIDRLVASSIGVVPGGFVTINNKYDRKAVGAARRKTLVRLFDPVKQTNRWEFALPSSARCSVLDDGHLAVLERSGKIQLLDLESGESRRFVDGIPASVLKRSRTGIFTLTDRDNLYLIVNRDRSGIHKHDEQMHVHGTIYAFSRQSGKRLWKRRASSWNLNPGQVKDSPLMVLTTRNGDSMGRMWYQSFKLLAIDKQTGRKLLTSSLSHNAGLQYSDVNMRNRFVEFRSFRERVRLVAVDLKPVAAEKPHAEKPQKETSTSKSK